MLRILLALLVLVAAAMPAAADAKKDALKRACHDDYKALCADVMPGGGRILACLHQHEDKLSAPCRAALQAQ